MSLMLHCGAQPVTRANLAALPLPEARGRYHKPAPYIDFVESVGAALQHVGLEITAEQFGLTKGADRFFGLMEVAPMIETERDFALMVGLRGSHDQSLPRGLAVGSRVFVCDNLAFTGSVTLHTKQTTHMADRLPGMVLEAVETIPGLFEVQDRRYAKYKQTELKPRWGDAALIELVRREVLTPSQLGTAIQEWDEPSHEEHLENGKTLWTLHNAVTEAIKAPVDEEGRPTRSTLLTNMNRTVGLTRFFDEVAGFTVH